MSLFILCFFWVIFKCIKWLAFSPFYFWDCGSSLLSLLWILFQVVGLFPLCLFGVVGFYLVSKFAQYFSVFSWYLTFCVWHMLSFLVLPSVGEAGPVVCVGCMLGGTCACLLVGGGIFPSLTSRPVWVVCVGVSVGSLSPLEVLLVVWVRCPSLGAASSWVVPGLGSRKGPSWEFSLINTPWDQEFSGHLVSWTQCFQPRGSGPISHRGTRIPQAVCYGNKGD